MSERTTILLKLTGEFLCSPTTGKLESSQARNIARQIKELIATHHFGIVVGGGSFFRGTAQGTALGMTRSASDQVGMLATVMNGIILQDIFEQEGLQVKIFSALACPEIGTPLSPQELRSALKEKKCLIFTGGLGCPFFTTDTNAIVRGLQIEAHEVWKVTKTNGIYSQDPFAYPDAELLRSISYEEAIERKLGIMDATALTLAQKHKMPLRIFSLFEPDALIKAARDKAFGSVVYP